MTHPDVLIQRRRELLDTIVFDALASIKAKNRLQVLRDRRHDLELELKSIDAEIEVISKGAES